ncbi:MAG: hypothetical protein LBM98_00670 [Oscillospiraceae bacterium]|nr:hypothetical protein [Oscillospiraceae bacterium]
MLRTCNVLRIASLPVLRKDGARRRETTPPPAGGTPPQRGSGRGFGRGYTDISPRNPRPTPIPSVEGCPRRGGVVPRAVRGEGGFETRPYEPPRGFLDTARGF